MIKKLYFLSFLLFGFLMVNTFTMAQETELSNKDQRKLEKEQKKDAQKAQDAEKVEILKNLLTKKFFVFQGSRLNGPGGDSWALTQDINFLAVMDTNTVLQFGFHGLVGWNGAGGITIEGIVDNYSFDDGGDKNAMTVTSQVRERIGRSRAYFVITVRDDGRANLDLTVAGATYRMNGRIVNPVEAGVFKGQYY
jgi:hypothetical protein